MYSRTYRASNYELVYLGDRQIIYLELANAYLDSFKWCKGSIEWSKSECTSSSCISDPLCRVVSYLSQANGVLVTL
ncbi:hypothetical protein GBA52_021725 [Prunus armeniaca]|nr:hypothetical protein GBA52_021725 [Prunus armeniaca]